MFFRAVVVASSLVVAACSSSSSGPAVTNAAPTIEAPVDASAPDASDAEPEATPVCDVATPRTTPLEVSVQPDSGATPFTDVLDRATRSIRVLIYEMGTGPILDALEAKARAGVKVQIIMDLSEKSTNQKYMDQLIAAGANVIWSDPKFSYMHAKVLVVDEAEAVISTGNYAAFRMAIERNFAAHDVDPADVDMLVKLFDADFNRATPDLSCTRLLVSPINSKARILALIASAKTEIVVESMQLADSDVRSALVARKNAGVSVRVILADVGWVSTNADAATFLANAAIPARSMTAPAVHVKAIVVDGTTAYIGSENLSYTSLEDNREVGVIVLEPQNVATIHATFEKDWPTATPF